MSRDIHDELEEVLESFEAKDLDVSWSKGGIVVYDGSDPESLTPLWSWKAGWDGPLGKEVVVLLDHLGANVE